MNWIEFLDCDKEGMWYKIHLKSLLNFKLKLPSIYNHVDGSAGRCFNVLNDLSIFDKYFMNTIEEMAETFEVLTCRQCVDDIIYNNIIDSDLIKIDDNKHVKLFVDEVLDVIGYLLTMTSIYFANYYGCKTVENDLFIDFPADDKEICGIDTEEPNYCVCRKYQEVIFENTKNKCGSDLVLIVSNLIAETQTEIITNIRRNIPERKWHKKEHFKSTPSNIHSYYVKSINTLINCTLRWIDFYFTITLNCKEPFDYINESFEYNHDKAIKK